MNGKQLTVGSLREQLEDLPPDMAVSVQFLDPEGPVEAFGPARTVYVDDYSLCVVSNEPLPAMG